MPVQYKGILSEHMAVRNSVGVFDLSHMGEFFITGPEALKFVQLVTTNDVSKLSPGKVQYSAACYKDGGVVDDLLVYCLNDNEYMMVVNAANISKDFEWFQTNLQESGLNAKLEDKSDNYSLLA